MNLLEKAQVNQGDYMKTLLAFMLFVLVSSMAVLTEYRVVCNLQDLSIVRFNFNGVVSKAGTFDVIGEYTHFDSEANIVEQTKNSSIRFTTEKKQNIKK